MRAFAHFKKMVTTVCGVQNLKPIGTIEENRFHIDLLNPFEESGSAIVNKLLRYRERL